MNYTRHHRLVMFRFNWASHKFGLMAPSPFMSISDSCGVDLPQVSNMVLPPSRKGKFNRNLMFTKYVLFLGSIIEFFPLEQNLVSRILHKQCPSQLLPINLLMASKLKPLCHSGLLLSCDASTLMVEKTILNFYLKFLKCVDLQEALIRYYAE